MRDTKSMEPLSVCITTKNVVDTIEMSLESASEIADEIVIIDCGSDDGTLDICKKYNTVIYEHDFSGFADLFRDAISKAQNDWVFLLDADEEISKDLRDEIELKLTSPGKVAFDIPIRNHMFGDWVRTSTTKTSLAKRNTIEFRKKYIHPNISVREGFEDKVGTMSHPINHYSYNRVSDYIEKFNQYTALEAIKHVDSNEIPRYPTFFGKGIAVFLYHLLINRSIFDGYRGILFASQSFQYKLVTHAKIKDLQRLKEQEPDEWRAIWLEEECSR